MAAAEGNARLPERVTVGRIHRPHGLRGEVTVESLTDFDRRWQPGSVLSTDSGRLLEVVASRPHRGSLLVLFAGVEDRDAAEALRGELLEVERSAVPPAEAGSYYVFELVGCRCRDRTEGELGEVVEVVEDGGGWLLWVEQGSRRLPVPLVERFLVRVDVEAGEIDLDLPPGLVEICGSR